MRSNVIRYSALPQITLTGVNTHFKADTMTDLRKIDEAGFRVIRDDLLWSKVETRPGIYDFSTYDHLINHFCQRGIRPMFIVGGNNPLYAKHNEPGYRLVTQIEIEAFTRFVRTAMQRYRGQNIIWEFWNEPNHPLFWKPHPNVTQYIQLAKQVLPVMRYADPAATIIAPCTAGSPVSFIRDCLNGGLMQWVDGISIHPYQAFNKVGPVNRDPEFAMPEIDSIRQLMQSRGYGNKAILLGEWGYSTAVGELSETQQAAYAARHYLLGLYYGTPINIWYDWKDDGVDPRNKEHHFGLMRPDLTPKPAYVAVKRLINGLQGFRFMSRLPLKSNQDHAWVFINPNGQRRMACWTQAAEHQVQLPGIVQPVLLTDMPNLL